MQEVNFLSKGVMFGDFVVLSDLSVFFFLFLFDQNNHVYLLVCCQPSGSFNLCYFLRSKIITQTGMKMSYCLLNR